MVLIQIDCATVETHMEHGEHYSVSNSKTSASFKDETSDRWFL